MDSNPSPPHPDRKCYYWAKSAGLSLLLNLTLFFQDDRIRRIIDTTDISLLPSLNPDGFSRAKAKECSGSGKSTGAFNDNDVDLNKDFPDLEDWIKFHDDEQFSVYEGINCKSWQKRFYNREANSAAFCVIYQMSIFVLFNSNN